MMRATVPEHFVTSSWVAVCYGKRFAINTRTPSDGVTANHEDRAQHVKRPLICNVRIGNFLHDCSAERFSFAPRTFSVQAHLHAGGPSELLWLSASTKLAPRTHQAAPLTDGKGVSAVPPGSYTSARWHHAPCGHPATRASTVALRVGSAKRPCASCVCGS